MTAKKRSCPVLCLVNSLLLGAVLFPSSVPFASFYLRGQFGDGWKTTFVLTNDALAGANGAPVANEVIPGPISYTSSRSARTNGVRLKRTSPEKLESDIPPMITIRLQSSHGKTVKPYDPVEKRVQAPQSPLQTRGQTKDVPPSRVHTHITVDSSVTYRLPEPTQKTPEEQLRPEGQRKRIGIVRPLSLNPLVHSTWFDLGQSGQASIMAIVSQGAVRIRVHFINVDLPPGAKLYVYSIANPDDLYGPYEGRGPFNNGTFWTPPVEGDGAIIEYFSPTAAFLSETGTPPFRISEISHVFSN